MFRSMNIVIISSTLKNKGFTLVELSIVIVVVGLIIAGVTAGSSMVSNARLMSIISEVNRYKTAISTFKLQYDALPGDFNKASLYWSGALNGDGNKIVLGTNEGLYAWKHMALAKLIPGQYTGAVGSGGAIYGKIGVNVPGSSFSTDAAYQFYTGSGNLYHAIQIGGYSDSCNSWINGRLLTVSQAYSIDKKIDDGLASSGNVFGLRGTKQSACDPGTFCTDNTSPTRSYILTDTSNAKTCRLLFWTDKRK